VSVSIADAPWLKAPETRAVMAALEAARAGGSRFVGGCVRNTLMARAVDDIDIATQLLPNDVIAAAKARGLAAIPTGIEHGTITIVSNHKPHEVTTLRRDVSTDGRRATVAFTEDWAEDAQRRDFRMNALYAAPNGEIFDPTGGGIEDIEARRVIFVGDPDTRLREDYLRILRFFRFNAWYGQGALDGDGLAACARNVGGLDALSAERVWKEIKKTLAAPDPRIVLSAMDQTGACVRVMPELLEQARLFSLIVLENECFFPPDAMARLAAGLNGPDAGRRLAQRLKLSNEERERLVDALDSDALIAADLSPREARRVLYRIGKTTFRDRVLRAWAEGGADKDVAQWRALLALAENWTRPKLPLSGDEAIAAGAKAGPQVGQVMRAVEDWWVGMDFPDNKPAVMARLKVAVEALS
jgi:poly(A) polymerase